MARMRNHRFSADPGFELFLEKPLRGEVLPKLAAALNVSADILLGVTPAKPKKQAAKGRLQLVFEAASKLPRRQQDKVAEFVEAFVTQHNDRAD